MFKYELRSINTHLITPVLVDEYMTKLKYDDNCIIDIFVPIKTKNY